MENRRLIIAVLLSIGVLFAWSKLFPPTPPPHPAVTATAPETAAHDTTGGAAPAGTPEGAPGTLGTEPEQQLELRTPDVRFVFSSLGGTLRGAQLLDPKYRAHAGDPDSGRELVTVREASQANFRTTFDGIAVPGGAWQASRPAPDTVLFVADTPTVRVEKRYRADTTRFRLHLDVVVQNKTDREEDENLTMHVAGRQDPQKKSGGFFSGSSANPSSLLCYANEKVEREPIEKLGKDPIDKTGTIDWIGADEKFFLVAAVPYPEPTPHDRTCRGTPIDAQTGEGTMLFGRRTVPPRGSTSYAFALFVGPKFIDELRAVQPGGVDVNLGKSVDVSSFPGVQYLAGPIMSLLKFFHGFVHNWGVAIILLTLFIKLVTFYPTQKSMLSAKKMQKLAPKMNAIRKKYENDKQRQSVETMNLYKAHGVSPFGGCLPSLIQMPIWIALYSTLNYAVELYRAPFIFYIHDLTDKDPYYITPLLMGGVMYINMKMSPASPDNQQQATMQLMMPIMFTAFSLVLPSGLALYMLTSYLIGILQQLYINRVDRKATAGA
jgi:YidC/Oxa1 family membrane protein insertase